MTRVSSRALAALMLLGLAVAAGAQDSVAAPPHRLPLDLSRVRSFHRAYDMIVTGRDSAVAIGIREVDVAPSVYAGTKAWLITETRTGAVASAESLFVTPDLRPLHWSSTQGLARLGAEFVGDSIYGAVTTPAVKQNIVSDSRADVVLSPAMLEIMLSVLPLDSGWSDSLTVLQLDLSTHQLIPADIAVLGDEEVVADSVNLVSGDSASTSAWVVALRTADRHTLYWVDKRDGAILRMLQPLPQHVGTDLQYRLRIPLAIQASPSP